MRKNLIITILLMLFSSSLLFAQPKEPRKVGTTGPSFYDLFSSVNSIGMGEAGVAVPIQNSFYHNPANLGILLKKNNVSVSFNPKKIIVSPNTDYYSSSFAFPLYRQQNSDWQKYIGVAYYYGEFGTIEPVIETDYSMDPAGVDRIFSFEDISHNLVLSAALVNSKFDIAGGFTVKYYKESVVDDSFDGYAFDVGSVLRYKLINQNDNINKLFLFPAIGVAVKNFGPDMKGFTSALPLPTTTTIGFSLETGLGKKISDNNSISIFTLIPAVDFQKDRYDYWKYHYGLDASLFELFNARYGIITTSSSDNKLYTFGYSLSSNRIGKFIKIISGNEQESKSKIINFVKNKLDISYNYATYDESYKDAFHEIIISYNLGN